MGRLLQPYEAQLLPPAAYTACDDHGGSLAALPLLDLLGEQWDDQLHVHVEQLLEEDTLACLEEEQREAERIVGMSHIARQRHDLAESRLGQVAHQLGRQQRGVPAKDGLVRDTRGEGGLHDLHRVEHAAAAQLLEHHARLEGGRAQRGVWLDAAHKVRAGGGELHKKRRQVSHEPSPDRVERGAPLGPGVGDTSRHGGALDHAEDGPDQREARGLELAGERGGQRVVVLLEPRAVLAIVADLAREVVDHECLIGAPLGPLHGRGEVGSLVCAVDGLAERGVAPARDLALRVEDAQDAVRVLLDEVDAALVVLELNRPPVDALLPVDLLLRFEDAPQEELLQLLVGIVDAQLLEAVALEALKAEDVE